MIRKFLIAAAALVTIGTASLTATPASAHHWGGGGFHHFHGGGFGLRVYSGVDSCLRTRYVLNVYGELVPRTVNICY
jgi:hypothetical protein